MKSLNTFDRDLLGSAGSEIAKLRRSACLSRNEVSERIGCHPNTLALLERGRMDASCVVLSRALAALDCSMAMIRDGLVSCETRTSWDVPPDGVAYFVASLSPSRLGGTMGKALRDRRQVRQLSLNDLSRLCGLHRNTIWGVEQGSVLPSMTTLHRMYRALGVTGVSSARNRVLFLTDDS